MYEAQEGGKVNDMFDIIGRGTIRVKAKGVILDFTNVWHAPQYTTTVLSVDVLATKKLFFTSEDSALYCRLPDQTRDIVCYTERRLGQYVVEYRPLSSSINQSINQSIKPTITQSITQLDSSKPIFVHALRTPSINSTINQSAIPLP